MSTRILLVEDNPLTLKGLQYLLEHEGYTVITADRVEEAKTKLSTQNYDLALLDVTLPDGDGFQVASELRTQHPATRFIFITARDDEDDIVHGLELGSEDYITKPFRNRELLLRIRKALDRHRNSSNKQKFGDLLIDTANGEVEKSGRPVTLTPIERRLLICLVEHAGTVVTRERLLDEIWDASGSVVNNNTLSVYLKRLRSKLDNDQLIETVKNIGYRFRRQG